MIKISTSVFILITAVSTVDAALGVPDPATNTLLFLAYVSAAIAIVFSLIACCTHWKASRNRSGQAKSTDLLNPGDTQYSATEFKATNTSANFTSSTVMGGTTMMNTIMPLAIPAYMEMNFDDFQLIKKVAEGGAGIIYIATPKINPDLPKTVVLKIMKDNLKEVPEMRDLFYQEVAITQSFSGHRNFINMYGFINEPRGMVMKLYEHGSLDDAILRKSNLPLNFQNVRTFANDIASALQEMHGRLITHNDIKPDNILIDRDDRGYIAVVCDYSISTANGKELRGVKRFRTVGVEGLTLGYAAPEIIQRHSKDMQTEVTPDFAMKADIYSAGITIYAMFIQQKPWVTTVKSSSELTALILQGGRPPFPDLQMIHPDAGQRAFYMRQIIERAWAQDPLARPSARDLIELLKQT